MIPCHQVMGHGESCCEGHLCAGCTLRLDVDKLIALYEKIREDGKPNPMSSMRDDLACDIWTGRILVDLRKL